MFLLFSNDTLRRSDKRALFCDNKPFTVFSQYNRKIHELKKNLRITIYCGALLILIKRALKYAETMMTEKEKGQDRKRNKTGRVVIFRDPPGI